MWREMLRGVFVVMGYDEIEAAAREWEALRAGLGLAPEATAVGVVTEFHRLRARVAELERAHLGYVVLDG